MVSSAMSSVPLGGEGAEKGYFDQQRRQYLEHGPAGLPTGESYALAERQRSRTDSMASQE